MLSKEAQDRIAEEKDRAAEAIARVEREETLKDSMPVRPDSAYSFKAGEAHITYRGGNPSHSGKGLPLAAVLDLLEKIPPLERSHRKAGCLSINPDGWHGRYADDPEERRSLLDVTIEGGEGFGPSVSVNWHHDAGGVRVRVSAELGAYQKGIGVSHQGRTYYKDGRIQHYGRTLANPIHGAHVVNWSAGSPGAYRVGWYWPTLEAFRAWAATVGA